MKEVKLFGKSKSGKIKQWSVLVEFVAKDCSVIEIKHGFLDGKKQVSAKYIKSGKNIGKSNETTPYEQAVLEAKSALSKKIDEGYARKIEDIPKVSEGLFLPMLAHSFDKHSKKINYPCWVQPKLDGVRMLSKKIDGKVFMWSRKGKVIDVPDKIKNQLKSLMNEKDCFDGELYVHGWDFQRIISAVKRKNSDTDKLQYHIYDMPEPNKTFENRFLKKDLNSLEGLNIKIVKTDIVDKKNNLEALERFYVKKAYEGVMVRNRNSLYEYKNRSYDLQKVKRFEDHEFEIIGGKCGTGKESGLVIFKCITEDGVEFDVRPKGCYEDRSYMYKNLESYIGKKLKVLFQGRTNDNVPRFPVGIGIRESWD